MVFIDVPLKNSLSAELFFALHTIPSIFHPIFTVRCPDKWARPVNMCKILPLYPNPLSLLCWCRWAPRQPGLHAAALLPTKAALPPARLRCCSGRRTPPQPGAAPLAASSLTLAGMRDRLLLGGGCRGASHVLRISTHSCGVLFGLYVQIFWRVLQLDTWFSNKVWCRVIDGWSTSSRTS